MKYMGSKLRHAKDILPIVLADHNADNYYVEPFVGGANIIDKVTSGIKRIGSDSNVYLIALWNAVLNGWEPPTYVDKEQYKHIRENINEYEDHLVGWVAHCCSYNGKWFGGFAGEITTKINTKRNYQDESRKAVLKQREMLNGTSFFSASYDSLEIPEKSTIYCDPPYKGTTKYKDSFDHDSFYSWCREKSADGFKVFISEYNMPSDFKCLWEKPVNSSLTQQTSSKKAVERLFTI